MATIGNERYLRYILLLGEGGLLVLRKIVIREVKGKPLNQLLANNRRLFQGLHGKQYKKLFPSTTTVNDNLDTWDISILHIVLRKLFWKSLSTSDQTLISDLKNFRNEAGHPEGLSMDEACYMTNRSDLENCLKQLISSLSQETVDAVEKIIEGTRSDDIDIQAALKHARELDEFKEDIIRALEERFSIIQSQLANIEDMVDQNRERQKRDSLTLKNIETIQSHQHEDVLDIKGTVTNKLLPAIQTMCDGLQTVLKIQTNNPENKVRAEKLLLDHILSIKANNLHSIEDIKSKISEIVTKFPAIDPDLLEAVLNLIKDVQSNPDVDVGETTLGSIHMEIKCISIRGLLRHMGYMASEECIQRLGEIAKSTGNILGIEISVSWYIVPESLRSFLFSHLKKPEKEDRETVSRSIKMKIHCSSIKGLSHIWNLFEEGAASVHLEKISDLLSKSVGADVRVSTSVEFGGFTPTPFATKQENVEEYFPEILQILEDSNLMTNKEQLQFFSDNLYRDGVVTNEMLTLVLRTMVNGSFAADNIAVCYKLLFLMSLPNVITASMVNKQVVQSTNISYGILCLEALSNLITMTLQLLLLIMPDIHHRYFSSLEPNTTEESEESGNTETSTEDDDSEDD